MSNIPLPSFKGWKNLQRQPTNRRIKKPTKANWFDFLKPIADIVGFAFQGLNSLFNWSMTGLVSLFVAGARFIWTFNWNISDEDLMTLLRTQQLAWYGLYGETIGQGLGWVICGLTPAATVLWFNKALGLKVLYDVGQEAYDELTTSLGLLLQASFRMKLNEAVVSAFIGFRWLIKNAANGQADTLLGGLAQQFFSQFPGLQQAAQRWGDKGGKPFILANQVEEWIEESPLPETWKTFLEELIEEFQDSCSEALFAFANSFDEAIALEALATGETDPNTVVVTPNRLAPNEKIILHGTPEQLKQSITTALANYQIVQGRDMGYDLGIPLIERAHKQISEYVITLFLKSRQSPPYGRDAKQHQIKINSANKLKFTDFDKVIRALGGGGDSGNIGYMYGNFFARAQMSDGSTLELWTDSSANCKLRVAAIAELTEAEIQTLNITEEIKDYQRKKIDGIAKDTYRVYPWKMEVIRKAKVYNDYDLSNNIIPGGRPNPTKQGYYKHSPVYTLTLWQGQEPVNWTEVMQELTAVIPPVSP